MVFQFGTIHRKYWESPQKWLPFPFKIETCLEEHFFYVADFEVTLEMSVKLAGGETYSFHGNNTGEGSEFLIPKQHRRGFRISDPSNNTGVSEFLFPHTPKERIQNFWTPKQHRWFRISDPPHTTGEDTEFLIPKQHRRFRISDPPNNTYILLEGLVCSIVRYFYESRCILASPRVQIQETSRNRTH